VLLCSRLSIAPVALGAVGFVWHAVSMASARAHSIIMLCVGFVFFGCFIVVCKIKHTWVYFIVLGLGFVA
jgi:hypothetical protein